MLIFNGLYKGIYCSVITFVDNLKVVSFFFFCPNLFAFLKSFVDCVVWVYHNNLIFFLCLIMSTINIYDYKKHINKHVLFNWWFNIKPLFFLVSICLYVLSCLLSILLCFAKRNPTYLFFSTFLLLLNSNLK